MTACGPALAGRGKRMHWAWKAIRAVIYSAAGALAGGLITLVVVVLWTTVFSGLPSKHVLDYLQRREGYSIFLAMFVGIGVVVGLGVGLYKALRPK